MCVPMGTYLPPTNVPAQTNASFDKTAMRPLAKFLLTLVVFVGVVDDVILSMRRHHCPRRQISAHRRCPPQCHDRSTDGGELTVLRGGL